MCLIIKCDKNIPLNQPLVEHWLEKNGDGWGMMYIQNNAIQTVKSMEPEKLWDKYLELQEFDPVIHLRWRTHGDTDLANCHPYYCGHGIFLMHNGVIGDASNRHKEKSDTWHFVEDTIKGLFDITKNPHEAMRSQAFKHVVEKTIGSTNRIILGDRGGYVIFNEQQWHTISTDYAGVKGLLVSNGYAWDSWGYGKPKPQQTYPNAPVHDYTGWDKWRAEQAAQQNNTYYQTNRYAPKEPIPHIDGTFRNSVGMKMTHVLANLYISEGQEVWAFIDGYFRRMEKLDKNIRNRLKKEAKKQAKTHALVPKQTSLILLPKVVDETPSPIAVNDPDDGDTDTQAERVVLINQQEYNEILVREWKNSTKAAIHTLVYAEPEDAATVLCSLLGK